MKILFLTYHFAPYNHIGAVRCTKTAKYLSQAGDNVRVLTAAGQPFPATLDVEIASENIRQLPCPHLDRIARSASKLGQTDPSAASRISLSNGRARILRKLYNVYKQIAWYPDHITGWRRSLIKAALQEVEQFQPDVILASGPPYTPLIAASEVSRKTGIPWVCELRDLWVDNHNYQYPAWRRSFEDKLEYRTLSTAGAFITVSEPLAAKLQKKYTAPVHVVPNGFDPADYPQRDDSLYPSDAVNLVFTGTIYKGKQDIQPLLKALSRVNSSGQHVLLHLYGSSLGEVVAQGQAMGIGNSLHYHGAVPYRQSLAAQRSADALVMLNWNDPQERGVYSGKLFEYIGAKRPILCVGSNGTVASDLIQQRNIGFFSSDPSELADILLQLCLQKRSAGQIADLTVETGKGFTRQEQTLRIREIIGKTAECLEG